MTDPTYYIPLAKAAEAAGYHAMTIPDSVAYPFESDSKYPYTPDGSREFLDDKSFVEAFVMAGALCAVTTTLKFNFFVLKLPIRPPALVAKQAGSLAALFDNRLGLGVGTSPWPEDYELMGVPFAKRGKRMDECIEIIRGLTSGGYFEFHGEFYDIPKTKMSPAPTKPVPILVGGHADVALRRAARNDGWMHGGGDLDELVHPPAAPGEWNVQQLVVLGPRAGADAEPESVVEQRGHRSGLLGHQRRRPDRQFEDEHVELQRRRDRAQGAGQHERLDDLLAVEELAVAVGGVRIRRVRFVGIGEAVRDGHGVKAGPLGRLRQRDVVLRVGQ